MDYLAHGYSLFENNPNGRIAQSTHQGRNIWIKRTVSSKAGIWHKAQKILSFLLPNPILRATVSEDGTTALINEATRLRELKSKGHHVPEVIAVNSDLLVISDLGVQLKEHLDTIKDPEMQKTVLRDAVNTLGRLHHNGLAHGRPYLRDMTWDGDRIGFIDLEENPAQVMSIAAAQARDIWIFLSSACRFERINKKKIADEKGLIDDLFQEYRKTANAEVITELEKFIKLLKPLRPAVEKILWQHVGNDVRRAALVTRCIERYID